MAQDQASRDYDIAAQDLTSSLRDVTREAGLELLASPDDLRGRRAPAIRGQYTPGEAITELLRGTRLTAEIRDGAVFIRGREEPRVAAAVQISGEQEDILVTGSRIRGGQSASPILTRTQDDIRRSGTTNLGAFARSLPQSFGGGQNPGVTVGVSGTSNENLNSASSLNLRGLGPDATLTLLNGHRLAYNSAVQAIDISAIPLVAVDRIEIITDGASAIYGSDAVAGVANIILKRSYDGLSASARVAASTDGGNWQQQYSVTGGVTGSEAGFIMAYNFERDTAIWAGQRSYTAATFPTFTLLPSQRHHSAIFSGFWQPAEAVTISGDAVFSDRGSTTRQPLASDDVLELGYLRMPKNRSYSFSPKLAWTLGNGWEATFLATLAEDKTDVDTKLFSTGTVIFGSVGAYRNRTNIAEINVEGALLRLPGGNARFAVGIGYRSNELKASISTLQSTGPVPAVHFTESRDSRYAFGELLLPIASPDLGIPLIHRLSLSAAARFEDYGDMGNVTTPKLGVVYAPTSDIDLKFSWGRSFKTPTLYQEFLGYSAQLSPISQFASAGYPSDATVLVLFGGNRGLRPERASTWTASVAFHPERLSGLRLEASVFHVSYDDRIAQPGAPNSGLLANPAFAALVNLNPTQSGISEAIAGSSSGLENLTGMPFDPLTVVALVDKRYLNLSSERMHGVDVAIEYKVDLTSRDRLSFSGNASYLDSKRRLTPTSPELPAAGVVFNPPHWRARAGAAWSNDLVSVNAFGNYIGSVRDNRLSPDVRVAAMTTLDLTAIYRMPKDRSFLGGIEVTVSVLNLFNEKPARIYTLAAVYPAFDSTNYSAVGRFVSISVAKHF